MVMTCMVRFWEQEMSSFRDKTLSNSLFLLHLMWAIQPRVIDWSVVEKGNTEDERLRNARYDEGCKATRLLVTICNLSPLCRYAVSVARKLGAMIFVLPEDLVEVKPNMIMSFCASILAIDHLKKKNASA